MQARIVFLYVNLQSIEKYKGYPDWDIQIDVSFLLQRHYSNFKKKLSFGSWRRDWVITGWKRRQTHVIYLEQNHLRKKRFYQSTHMVSVCLVRRWTWYSLSQKEWKKYFLYSARLTRESPTPLSYYRLYLETYGLMLIRGKKFIMKDSW